jgi:hypothetical protein
MNFRALVFLGFAGLLVQPASAQTAPSATPASANVRATIDSLLASGYEIKAVTVMSDAAIKEMFGGQSLTSHVFITLQKGGSIAVCENSTLSWIQLTDSQMMDVTRCWKR